MKKIYEKPSVMVVKLQYKTNLLVESPPMLPITTTCWNDPTSHHPQDSPPADDFCESCQGTELSGDRSVTSG